MVCRSIKLSGKLWGVAWLACCAVLSGCSSAPPQRPAASPIASLPPAAFVGNEIALRAISLLGRPYRYGGAGPTAFDCSGLVRFIHNELGIEVPRTAAEQHRAATPVKLRDLTPGDLLFFKISGSRVSHVAIYAGEGRFVHAPQTGRPVELRTLDDEFYRPRLAGVGRLF